MSIESLTKQGFDSFVLTANFEDNMRIDDTIDLGSCTISATDKDGEDASSAILDQGDKAESGTQLQIRVKAGTQDLSPYSVRFQCVTTFGDQWEKDVRVKIKEVI